MRGKGFGPLNSKIQKSLAGVVVREAGFVKWRSDALKGIRNHHRGGGGKGCGISEGALGGVIGVRGAATGRATVPSQLALPNATTTTVAGGEIETARGIGRVLVLRGRLLIQIGHQTAIGVVEDVKIIETLCLYHLKSERQLQTAEVENYRKLRVYALKIGLISSLS